MIASVTVDFDKSVFLMMALFSVAILILKPLLFDPMLRVFALREERTDGAKAEARAMQEKAADLLRNYEVEVERVRTDATLERDNLRKETAQLEAQVLHEARVSVAQVSDNGRARIESELLTLKADLERKAAETAKEIASKILGREMQP